MSNNEIQSIIESLTEIGEDTTVPRNVRQKIEETITILNKEDELSIKVSKALHFLEEISDDVNLQPYTRTQVWNIISILEKVSE